MYTDRLRTLTRAYSSAAKNNQAYTQAQASVASYRRQLSYIGGLNESLRILSHIISGQEEQWQAAVLKALEAEIMEDLAFIYPSDGYSVSLDARVLRGKIHIEATVHSYFTGAMPGGIDKTQGRLFQQIVSFAALIGIMHILGINTVYVDEAFSGAAKANVKKVNALLKHFQERGFNIVLIAQDTSMANGIEANTLVLSRSLDNKTTIKQMEVHNV